MKTLIIGLGNPILSDDGVGVKVAQALARTFPAHTFPEGATSISADQEFVAPSGKVVQNLTITEASVGGLRLMEMMVGYDRAILIDAITHGDDPPGTVRRMSLADLDAVSPTQHTASAHDTSLATALAMGRRMGVTLPADLTIFAVSVVNVIDFADTLTPAVAAAIPKVVAAVLAELSNQQPTFPSKLLPANC